MTLDATVRIPDYVLFTFLEQDAILLNTQTTRYFVLDEVGRRLWGLLKDGKTLKESCQVLLEEYEVNTAQLEQDVLELVDQLRLHELVEIVQV